MRHAAPSHSFVGRGGARSHGRSPSLNLQARPLGSHISDRGVGGDTVRRFPSRLGTNGRQDLPYGQRAPTARMNADEPFRSTPLPSYIAPILAPRKPCWAHSWNTSRGTASSSSKVPARGRMHVCANDSTRIRYASCSGVSAHALVTAVIVVSHCASAGRIGQWPLSCESLRDRDLRLQHG